MVESKRDTAFRLLACASFGALIVSPFLFPRTATGAADADASTSDCYGCHDTIETLHTGGKHASLHCSTCHAGLGAHLEKQDAATRPTTDLTLEKCGSCHKPQYDSAMATAHHRPGRDEKSQLTGRSPNPFWDLLMMGHGFTAEHATTRSHAWMMVDHLVVDRAYGGRFQPKQGWQYLAASPTTPLWDILEDRQPAGNEHKPFLPQSKAAANPTCFQCKSQDKILEWAFLGDPAAKAPWSRASNVVDLARSMRQGLNCFTCHDPHAAKPRIVRDALIQALAAPDGDTLWHKDDKRTKITVMDMGVRGFPRKIALLEKYDTRLQCGQCHVEYNCNPGTDVKTGQPVKFDDPRTNHIPYKEVTSLYDHYVGKIGFLDFKHTLTGGLLWKAQHAESETFYNSRMGRKGVGCDDCHLPALKDASGKPYTSHFAVAPRVQVKETCLRCHSKWDAEQALYVIDSVKTYNRGKMRKAEFWIAELIDRIVEARKAAVDAGIVKQAQEQHLRAHILWEWWTAENSDGFHNPDLARESLTRSMDESQKGLKLLDEAMAGAGKK